MINQFKLAACAGSIAVAVSLYACAMQYVRMVNEEDDCAFNTYAVERLPLIGLVCIGG